MKRRIIEMAALLLTGGLIMFGFFSCGAKKYTVDYGGQKTWYENAKDAYRAGETVRIYYSIFVTDTDYTFYLDGEPLNPDYSEKHGYVIKFTMPAHDVQLRCESFNSMEPRSQTVRTEIFSFSRTTSAVEADYEEILVERLETDELRMHVRRFSAAGDLSETRVYAVPEQLITQCEAVIQEYQMRKWENMRNLDCLDGVTERFRFMNADGSYTTVSTDAFPAGGEHGLSEIRSILLRFAAEEAQLPEEVW